MKLIFFTEVRLEKYRNNFFYSDDHSFSPDMFSRYLKIFSTVLIVARVLKINNIQNPINNKIRVDSENINILPLPYYIGPYQYIVNRNNIINTIKTHINNHPDAAAICRVPGTIGTIAAKYLSKQHRPYGVEVVGDPKDVFAPGSFPHPLRRFFRYIGTRNLKIIVESAAASLYVTKFTLQKNYPPSLNSFSTYASNVTLHKEYFANYPKHLTTQMHYLCIAVGSLAVMYKSPDVAINSIKILKNRGLNVSLRWLGDGKYRNDMIEMSNKLGISDRVSFIGNVASATEIIDHLDAANIFLIPSMTEGLPRSLIEAMARGLPCIGSRVGGIPELLNDESLVPINNPELLANKIEFFCKNTAFANAQATRNLKEASNYALDILNAKRAEFYQHIDNISSSSINFLRVSENR